MTEQQAERLVLAVEQLVRILAERAEPDVPRVRPPMTVTEKGERRAA